MWDLKSLKKVKNLKKWEKSIAKNVNSKYNSRHEIYI